MKSLEMAQCFYKKGIRFYDFDNEGNLPIHYAALEDYIEILEWFLHEDDRLINIKNDYGWTPLHAAAISHSINAMQCLIKNGADIETTDDNYRTAIDILRQDKDYISYFGSYSDSSTDNTELLNILEIIGNADV